MSNKNFEDYNKLRKFFEEKGIFLLVYLFGSKSIDKAGPLSDYDFGILPIRHLSSDEKYHLIHELTILLNGDSVDLILLDEAPVELKYNIISTGIILYKKDNFHKVEFEANTLSQYFDYLPILHSFKEKLLERGNYDTRIQRNRESLRKTERMLEQIRAAKR